MKRNDWFISSRSNKAIGAVSLLSLCICLLLTRATSLAQTSGEDLLKQAQQDYKSGAYEQAEPKLSKALSILRAPEKKADAHLVLGLIYFDDRKEDQAKTQFALARGLNPNLELDRQYYSPDTVEAFDQAKQDGVSYFQRGKAFAAQAKDKEALEQLDLAINLLQSTDAKKNQLIIVDACFTAARIHETEAKDDQVVIYFQRALMSNPDLELEPEKFNRRLMELFNQAKFAGNQVIEKARDMFANKMYDPAIETLEKNKDIYFAKETKKAATLLLAEVHFANKKESVAIDTIRTLLNLDPAFEPSSEMKQSAFGQFFLLQRIKISGKLPKILIVRGREKNPAHELVIESFKKEIIGDKQETTVKNLKKDAATFSPDAILLLGRDTLEPARKLNFTVPLIFANVPRAETMELKSPNVGGIYIEISLEEQFSALRSVLPNAKRVGVLYNAKFSGELIKEAKRQAENYNLELIAEQVEAPEDMENAFKKLGEIDAFWTLLDASTAAIYKTKWGNLIGVATKKNIPIFAYGDEEMAKEGALVSLSSNFGQIGKQVADLTQKVLILKPKTLPAVYPSFSVLALNIAAAKKLNIEINPNLITKSTVVFR